MATITIHSFDMAACHDVLNMVLLGVDRVLGLVVFVGSRVTIHSMLSHSQSDMRQSAKRVCVGVQIVICDQLHAERHLI